MLEGVILGWALLSTGYWGEKMIFQMTQKAMGAPIGVFVIWVLMADLINSMETNLFTVT